MRDRIGSSLAHSVYTNYKAKLLRAFPQSVCVDVLFELCVRVCETESAGNTHTSTYSYFNLHYNHVFTCTSLQI